MTFIGNIPKILGGKALWATLYVLIYSLYTAAFSFKLNVNFIRIGYVLFYAFSVWYTLKVVSKGNWFPFLKILILFFSLVLIHGVIFLVQGTSYGHIQSSTFLINHAASVLPIFPFYYFGKYEKLTNNWFALMLILFAFDAYCLYYHNRAIFLESIINADEGFINNSGYVWASLLPFVAFLNKSKILQYLSIAIIMYFVLTCFKRGAIVVVIVSLLYFVLHTMLKAGWKQKILIVFLTIAGVLLLFNFTETLLSENQFFAVRMERSLEGDSGGRDSIYSFFYKYFFSAENAANIVFGDGAFATIKLLGIEAHNDWLEYAIDMGLIGIVLYFFYWKRMAKNYFYFSKYSKDDIILTAMGMVLIINFIRTFVSMSFSDMSFFSAALIGYTMAVVDKQRFIKAIIK